MKRPATEVRSARSALEQWLAEVRKKLDAKERDGSIVRRLRGEANYAHTKVKNQANTQAQEQVYAVHPDIVLAGKAAEAAKDKRVREKMNSLVAAMRKLLQ